MEKTSWIQEMRAKLKKQSDLLAKYTQLGMCLFVFGSAINSECPCDLDIVILYRSRDVREAQIIRDITVRYLTSIFEFPIDCVLLSFDENEQVCFTSKEKAVLILP